MLMHTKEFSTLNGVLSPQVPKPFQDTPTLCVHCAAFLLYGLGTIRQDMAGYVFRRVHLRFFNGWYETGLPLV